MDESLQTLLAQLERVADQFRELRDGVQQVIKIAEASPEMALTRARKVLEYVIRDVYQRGINEPPGTRALENLLQRLVKDGFFPDRLDAYANTIRKLGNVGTHSFNENVAIADVYQSLAQLMPILQCLVFAEPKQIHVDSVEWLVAERHRKAVHGVWHAFGFDQARNHLRCAQHKSLFLEARRWVR